MKADIHPKYHKNASVVCSCGNTFTVGSTAAELRVEICSNCHPFYTGTDKLLDTAGRVERFKARATRSLGKKTASAAMAKKEKGRR